ncbi:M23 family metallopeptidase [Streptomyces sp. NPDC014733]|uniref:M23 family metallopeptidase n=1 Tax=Streptomyces sp. NPDC014733 TaxID=3364885 RepID=UPI0036F81CEF
MDLAAPPGTTVRAAAPGEVAFAGVVAGRGVVTVQLSDTGEPPLRTTYEPVHASVRKGDRVAAGQPVGVLQQGPFHCHETCLHWGLLRGKTYLDPLTLLPPDMRRTGPSRLLPLTGVPTPPDTPLDGDASKKRDEQEPRDLRVQQDDHESVEQQVLLNGAAYLLTAPTDRSAAENRADRKKAPTAQERTGGRGTVP